MDVIEYDILFTDDIIFPCGDITHHIGKLKERKCRPDGKFIGWKNEKPTPESCEYVLQYPDGTEYTLA